MLSVMASALGTVSATSETYAAEMGGIDHRALFSLAVAVVTVSIAAAQAHAVLRSHEGSGATWPLAVIVLSALWVLTWAVFGLGPSFPLQWSLAATFALGVVAGAASRAAQAIAASATIVTLPGLIGVPFVAAFIDSFSVAEALLFTGVIGLVFVIPLLLGAAAGRTVRGIARHRLRRRTAEVSRA